MKKWVLAAVIACCVALMLLPVAGASDVEDPDSVYLYGAIDADGDVMLRTDLLENIVSMETAVSAVRQQVNFMSADQKSNSADIDLCSLYAETAVAEAARKYVSGNEVVISSSTVSDVENTALRTNEALGVTLEEGGLSVARELANTVTFVVEREGKITIRITPDILRTKVDKVRVETPTYAITIKISDIQDDLKRDVEIVAEDVGTEYEPGTTNHVPAVKLELPNDQLSGPVTLAMTTGSADPVLMGVLDLNSAKDQASSSKYNPATTSLEAKVNTSGLYSAKNNAKDFSDIAEKDASMQKAIRALAARGIINGTSETTFNPDGLLMRSHFVTLVMRGLGKIDNSATASFRDATSGSFYYPALASSEKYSIIQGFKDGTFRPDQVLNKT